MLGHGPRLLSAGGNGKWQTVVLEISENLMLQAGQIRFIYLTYTDFKDAQYRPMVRKQRFTPIIVLHGTLVAVGAELLRGWHTKVLPFSTLIDREQDSIGVARCSLLLARIIDLTVLVVFERRQEINLILVEPPHELVSVLLRK